MNTGTIKNKIYKFDYKIIVLLVIISLIVFYFLVLKDIFKDKNVKLEEEMVEQAKNYITNNNISTTKEIYIDVKKLNIELDNRCSFTSGVIYDGANYIPNLVCNDYKSIVINSNQEIKDLIELKGDEVMILAKGINFYDPGYVSKDIVTTIGEVGTEEGLYNVYYKLKNNNKFAIRKIIVLDDDRVKNLFPSISLNGDDVVYVVEGNNYEEVGVIGNDSIDGDISSKVLIDGKVDSSSPGEYKLTYILTNSRGYSNIVIRKVNVISKNSDLELDYSITPSSLTNEDVTIKLSISNDFNKIIYPNGKVGRDTTYLVKENGIYKFTIYDIYDRIVEKEINITNIDKTIPQGNCVATLYYNRTDINVNVTTPREISTYEYILDNKSIMTTQSNSYTVNITKPNSIKVNLKDSINNKNEITCTKVENFTRKIVTNSKGKNCLEGYNCYVQYDYGNASKYPFCSMSNLPNSCGGIGRNGCSITSAANAIAAMGVKSKSGALYTPYTVWEELYPINKKTGQCNGGCSGWTRLRDSIINAGLSAPKSIPSLTKGSIPTIIDHLKKGYPVIVYAKSRPFSGGSAHYMTLLGVREDNYVFLSDSANSSGTKKYYMNGKQYYVDTWISTDDLINGNVKEYLLIGPKGMF